MIQLQKLFYMLFNIEKQKRKGMLVDGKKLTDKVNSHNAYLLAFSEI